MMKRILVLAILSFVWAIKSFGQCTPDTSLHSPGVYPDSLTGLMPATVNVAYNQVIQLVIPADTTVTIAGFPINVPIDSVHLDSFTGFPTGLIFTCGIPSCTYLGGTNGCALINGTPTDTGTFPLTANITYYAGGGLINQSTSITYYVIHVAGPTGFAEFASNNFEVKQNTPNPFNGLSRIYYNIPHKGKVEFKLFNLIGKEVFNSTELAHAGVNTFSVDSHNFSSGIYMYSVQFERQTITKRLVISGR